VATILLVDDEPSNLRILAAMLKPHYDIKVAIDGNRALSVAAAEPTPDLILLDVMMPGIDGREVCRRLKASPNTRDIPVIFVTALGRSVDEVEGFKLGAVDYITKPFVPPVILARVSTHLELRRKTLMLERMAQLDRLTELPNRRFLDTRLSEEWRRALRGQSPLGLAMLDVDHFKQFNDQHGHGAGDQCLRAVANALQGTMRRSSDFLARYGGEEFVAVLPGARLPGILDHAEHMRAAVEALAIAHASASNGWVGVSIGLAIQVPTAHDQAAELLASADSALYAAKASGRNQVALADGLMDE
jgi:diguanylate cyclase (GGDEF)-like protein